MEQVFLLRSQLVRYISLASHSLFRRIRESKTYESLQSQSQKKPSSRLETCHSERDESKILTFPV